jgi:HPr kinase/phosphorylase
MSQIHATAIAIDEQGILLTGKSGSGKSDLALRLIEQGAQLISDDRVELIKKGPQVIAMAPQTIQGKLEIRGLGIIHLHHLNAAPVRLVIDLDGQVERMPEKKTQQFEGVDVPTFSLNAFESSTPAKVSMALAIAMGHIECEE